MNPDLIRARKLYKSYDGHKALKDISFSISSGESIGLIGANGAGKTTLLRILATLLNPSSGEVYIKGAGSYAAGKKIRKSIGYLPEDGSLYPRMSGLQNLEFYLSFYDVPHKKRILNEYIKQFGLSGVAHKKVRTWSKGMRQKLQFIRALIHDPEILLLDEPFNGIDPESRLEIAAILAARCKRGISYILSSHILSDIESMCQRIIVLRDCNIFIDGTIESIRNKYGADDDRVLEKIYLNLMGIK